MMTFFLGGHMKQKLSISYQEVMRYAMCQQLDAQSKQQLEKAMQKISEIATHQYHFIILEKEDCLIQQMCQQSKTFRQHIKECHHIIMIGVTIGIQVDRLLKRLQSQNMSDALWHNAVANAYVEALCDDINEQLKQYYVKQNQYLTDRFSCGYADLSLTWQKDIIQRLDASKKIGLFVNEAMLLQPEKSVTAMIGIANIPQRARIRGCAYCDKKSNCEYRKGGIRCE